MVIAITSGTMKISDEMTYRLINSGLTATKQSVFQTQQQISSGRRVTVASDDPSSYEMIIRLKDDLSSIQQYARNAEKLETDLRTIDNSLQSTVSLLQRVQEIIIRGGDATISATDRTALANEVDGLLTQLIDTANISEGGRYIFAGLRTDTKPYVGTDTDADGLIDTVTYNGSMETKQVEIGNGVYIEGNIPGSTTTGSNAVFQTPQVDLFQVLIDLRDNQIGRASCRERV